MTAHDLTAVLLTAALSGLLVWPAPLVQAQDAPPTGPHSANEHVQTMGSMYRLLDEGRFVDAEAHARRAASTLPWATRRDSLMHSDLLGVVVEARLTQGLVLDRLTQEDAQRLLALRERLLPGRADLATALEYVAVVRRDLGDLDGAQRLLQQALAIHRSVETTPGRETARCLHQLASVMLAGGRYDRAESLLVVARSAIDGETAGDAMLLASIDFHRSQARIGRGDTTGVRGGFENARRLWQRLGRPASVASALHAQGVWELDRGRYADAARRLDEAIAWRRRIGVRPAELAASMSARARVFLHEDMLDSATTLIHLAHTLAAEAGDDGQVGACLRLRGEAALRAGDLETARNEYEGALRHARGAADSAACLQPLSTTLSRLGRAREADAMGWLALTMHHRLGADHRVGTAVAWMALARIARNGAELDSAEQRSARAIRDLEQILPPDHTLLVDALIEQAAVARARGDFARSRSAAERGLEMLTRGGRAEGSQAAACLGHVGVALRALGRYEEARTALVRALAILERRRSDRVDVASLLNSLGTVERRLGLVSSARDRYRAARELWASDGRDRPELALALRNLANLAQEQGAYDTARVHLEHALEITRRTRVEGHPEVASCLLGLGNAWRGSGNASEAQRWYRGALDLQLRLLGRDHPDLAVPLHNVAGLHLEAGELRAALDTALIVEDLTRGHFMLVGATLSESEALAYAASRPTGLHLAMTCALALRDQEAIRRTWESIMRSRGLVLDELAARRRVLDERGDEATRRLLTRLARARDALARIVVEGPERESDQRVRTAAARSEAEQAERALAEHSARFRSRSAGATLGTLVEALPQGSALVAFVLYRRLEHVSRSDSSTQARGGIPAYAAFVLQSRVPSVRLFDLGPAAAIEARIAAWQAASSRDPQGLTEADARWQSYLTLAAELRAAVWDSISIGIAGSERVFVVPDGALNMVNFAALPSASGRFLVEDRPTFHYLSTERDLAPGSPPRADGAMVIAAAPDYGRADARARTEGTTPAHDCVLLEDLTFVPLPGTMDEQEHIAALWRKHRDRVPLVALVGPAATERAFKTSASGARILHVATHGFFLDAACGAAPATAEVDIVGDEPDPSPRPNPLALSGLALSGANLRGETTSTDDGILTAEEIASLSLRGVDWAVLSACETALGETRAGEGVFGLRRAFQLAGVRTLIMTLWSVPDEPTRAWMGELYERRLRHEDPTANAVRTASLRVVQACRERGLAPHPYYWGAFIASGAWE